jgi:hypothetical protein
MLGDAISFPQPLFRRVRTEVSQALRHIAFNQSGNKERAVGRNASVVPDRGETLD